VTSETSGVPSPSRARTVGETRDRLPGTLDPACATREGAPLARSKTGRSRMRGAGRVRQDRPAGDRRGSLPSRSRTADPAAGGTRPARESWRPPPSAGTSTMKPAPSRGGVHVPCGGAWSRPSVAGNTGLARERGRAHVHAHSALARRNRGSRHRPRLAEGPPPVRSRSPSQSARYARPRHTGSSR
jgi:hypothetical protein